MYAVDAVCCDINCALETEGHVGSVKVIIYSLWKCNNVKSFILKKVRGFVCTVAAKNNHTVKIQLVIVMLHGFNLVETVLIRICNGLKWCS